MEQTRLEHLIAKLLAGDKAAHTELESCWIEDFNPENAQYILTATQAEIQKPDDQCCRFIYDLYIKATDILNPDDQANLPALERGITLGSAVAANLRGYYYEYGIGSEPDLEAAYQSFLKAAELGSIGALYSLGVYCYAGKVRAKNYIEAKLYFERCHKKNHPLAIIKLAKMNLRGHGFKKNPAEAVNLFRKSAQLAGKAVAAKIAAVVKPYILKTAVGYAQLDKHIIEIIKIAAELGQPGAMNLLGLLHCDLQQYDIARRYFHKAAKFLSVGYANIAKTYVHLENPSMNDLHMALINFELALANQHQEAFYLIALMYERSEYGINYTKAISYLERGVLVNEINCIERRAYYHSQGWGGAVDFAAAAALYERGGALNNAMCKTNLALLRLNNLITSITKKRAYALLEESIESNYLHACLVLAERTHQPDRAAYLYRKALQLQHSEEIRQSLRTLVKNNRLPIVRYHWYMSLPAVNQQAGIKILNRRYPWKIVHLILNDEFITFGHALTLLGQLPGHKRIHRHILELGIHHPTRTDLMSLAKRHYAELDQQEVDADEYGELDNIQLTRTPKCYAYLPERSPLRSYLQVTIIFEALINRWIIKAEIPTAVKMLCDFHHDLLEQETHFIAAFRPSAMMSMPNYWQLCLAHLQLAEVYVNELRNILLPHAPLFSKRQKLAMDADRGVLSLFDSILQADHHKKLPPHFKSTLITAIQKIKLVALYTEIKAQQARLSAAEKQSQDADKLAHLLTKFGMRAVNDHQQASLEILADSADITSGLCLDRKRG